MGLKKKNEYYLPPQHSPILMESNWFCVRYEQFLCVRRVIILSDNCQFSYYVSSFMVSEQLTNQPAHTQSSIAAINYTHQLSDKIKKRHLCNKVY